MTASYDDQIREWVQSGRISKTMADALLDHYSNKSDPLKKGPGEAPPSVDLMELMNLIDLLEKKEGPKRSFGESQNASPQGARSPGLPEPFLPGNSEKLQFVPDPPQNSPEQAKDHGSYEALQGKYSALEAELAAEKKAHAELAEKEFAYAKRFADAEGKRRQAEADEEGKRKTLEEENHRLIDELKRAHEEEARLTRKVGGLEILIDAPRAQAAALEQKCAEYEKEIERLEKVRVEREAASLEEERLQGVAPVDEKHAEAEKPLPGTEKADLAAELAGKNADIAELRLKSQKAAAAVEELKAQSLALEGRLQEAVDRCAAAKSEKERLETENRRFASEKEALSQSLAAKEAEIARLQEAAAAVETLKSQNLALDASLQESNTRCEAMRLETDRLEAARTAALEEQEAKRSARAEWENEKNRLEEEIRSLESSKKVLEENASQAAARTEEMRQRCAEFESEALRMRGAFEDKTCLEDELKREKETLAKVQAHAKYLETTLLALEKQINLLS